MNLNGQPLKHRKPALEVFLADGTQAAGAQHHRNHLNGKHVGHRELGLLAFDLPQNRSRVSTLLDRIVRQDPGKSHARIQNETLDHFRCRTASSAARMSMPFLVLGILRRRALAASLTCFRVSAGSATVVCGLSNSNTLGSRRVTTFFRWAAASARRGEFAVWLESLSDLSQQNYSAARTTTGRQEHAQAHEVPDLPLHYTSALKRATPSTMAWSTDPIRPSLAPRAARRASPPPPAAAAGAGCESWR